MGGEGNGGTPRSPGIRKEWGKLHEAPEIERDGKVAHRELVRSNGRVQGAPGVCNVFSLHRRSSVRPEIEQT